MRKLMALLTIIVVAQLVSAGNAEWKLLPSFTTDTIQQIQFVSRSTGWVRSSNLLFFSNDGGFSWNQKVVELDTVPTIKKIFFISANTGWFINGKGTRLYQTLDSGNSWNKCNVSGDDSCFNDLFFLDSLHGWACGTSSTSNQPAFVFYTIDGGKNWNKSKIDDGFASSFEGITFTDSLHGYAAGYFNGGSSMIGIYYSVSTIFRTVDGGKIWENCFLDTTKSNSSLSAMMSPKLRSCHFFGKQYGWALGSEVFDTDYFFQKPTMVFTSDSGKSWCDTLVFSDTESIKPNNLRDFSFIDSLHGFLVADNRIMQTSNGGKTWDSLMGAEVKLYSLTMLDATHGWAGGSKGLFYILSDNSVSIQPRIRHVQYSTAYSEALPQHLLNGQVLPKTKNIAQSQCHIVGHRNGRYSSSVSLRHR